MALDDQRDVIAFLSDPRAYGRPGERLERIDTHISIVWLVADHAFKLKRAVRFDYVDFSTIDRRREACEAEVRLNRRTAPSLYLGVTPVTREADGALALAGAGTPVDWLVEMARFEQEMLFDRLAARHALDPCLMEPLADAIVRLHATAEPCGRAGRDSLAWVVDGNALGFADARGVLDPAACARLTAASRAALDRHALALDARGRAGAIRRCHGDLHLRNICLVAGAPTLFDAVEFNDDISCIDVVYDLAFLLMDLWRQGLRAHANAVFNQYASRTDVASALPMLPLFLSCRAAVRAKTSISASRVQAGDRAARALETGARQYLALARDFLQPAPPCVVAVGGFSGSGKTTLARAIAPMIGAAPGALVLRSDVIRKRLLGVEPTTSLGPDGYAMAVSRRVYQTIAERARAAVDGGHAVVVDAVYGTPAEREAIEAVALRSGVPFIGLWIEGPELILADRLARRDRDASDATPDVMARQLRSLTIAAGWHRLDGSRAAAAVRRAAEAWLTDARVQALP